MSTSLLYHGFGIVGYKYVRTEYRKGDVIFTVSTYRSANRIFWITDNGSSHRGKTSFERLSQ